MNPILAKMKDLSSAYLYIIALGTGVYNLFVDCKSLRKKRLFKEEKISKFIGYGYIVLAIAYFIVTKYII